MEITAALAADLSALTAALDEPGVDMTATLLELAADARAAVGSYLGLSVILTSGGAQSLLTALEDHARYTPIRSSLRIPPSPDPPADPSVPASSVALVLYAARPGAFVDLAADLAWLTGRDLADFVLDEHLTTSAGPEQSNGLRGISLVNQAIGVLIAQGHTPAQAQRALAARAARDQVAVHVAADTVLSSLDREGRIGE